MKIFFSSRLVFRGILIIKQRCDQHSDKVKTWEFKLLLSKEEEGRSTKVSVWSTTTAKDWLGDFFFL